MARAKKHLHILHSQQFDRVWLEKKFFPEAKRMERAVKLGKELNFLKNKSICLLFYEPSTRTRLSFQQAALKLGAKVVATENAKEFSSAIKGETMLDTIRVLNALKFDAVIIRSDYEGASDEAASVAKMPVLNAGDGRGQHPTQSLLDLYTIYKQFGKIDGLRVVMVGDLLNGRTVRSLCYLLSKFKRVHLDLVAPGALQMRQDLLDYLKSKNVEFAKHSSLDQVAPMADVIYMTRAQKERMDKGVKVSGKGVVMTRAILSSMKKKAVVMHPLPRSNDFGELLEEFTDDPHVIIFDQVESGLYTRMALLKMALS